MRGVAQSLQSHIALVMWVVTVLSTIAAATLSGALLVRSHRESIRQQLQASATSLISLGMSDFSELEDFDSLDDFIENALQMEKVDKIIRIYDANGKSVFSTVHVDEEQLPAKLENRGAKPFFLTLEGLKGRYESLVVPYQGERNKKRFYLQVIIPLPRYTEILSSFWWQFLLLLGLLLSLSMVVSQRLSKHLLKPVGDITEHLLHMDPTHIEDWQPLNLEPSGGRYLETIVDGINHLSERIQEAVLQIQKMSRYVAHEMRTPLTILQGEAETVLLKPEATIENYSHVLKSSLEEIHRMSGIVDTVLQIGEKNRRLTLHKPTPCHLIPWLQENCAGWERTLGRPLHLILPENLSPSFQIRLDTQLLYRLIDNLVRNVSKHAFPSSTCELALENKDESLRLILSDYGPGLEASKIESLNLIGRSSKGIGVGLHLCHTIAEICGYKLKFSNRPEGGLRVEIRI